MGEKVESLGEAVGGDAIIIIYCMEKIFAIKTRTRILLLGSEALFERKDISHTHQPSKVGVNQLHNAVL